MLPYLTPRDLAAINDHLSQCVYNLSLRKRVQTSVSRFHWRHIFVCNARVCWTINTVAVAHDVCAICLSLTVRDRLGTIQNKCPRTPVVILSRIRPKNDQLIQFRVDKLWAQCHWASWTTSSLYWVKQQSFKPCFQQSNCTVSHLKIPKLHFYAWDVYSQILWIVFVSLLTCVCPWKSVLNTKIISSQTESCFL